MLWHLKWTNLNVECLRDASRTYDFELFFTIQFQISLGNTSDPSFNLWPTPKLGENLLIIISKQTIGLQRTSLPPNHQ